MRGKRLLAIDPSLTCSGWALFGVQKRDLLAVGKIRSLPPKIALVDRLRDLQLKIGQVFDSIALSSTDLLICEAPTTMRDPKAAIKVEQVRGMFETLARIRGAEIPGRINPRTVHREVLGLTGKQLPRVQVKSIALQAAFRLFQEPLKDLGLSNCAEDLEKHQDIVDAVLVGYIGLCKINEARLADGLLSDPFAEKKNMRRRAWA